MFSIFSYANDTAEVKGIYAGVGGSYNYTTYIQTYFIPNTKVNSVGSFASIASSDVGYKLYMGYQFDDIVAI